MNINIETNATQQLTTAEVDLLAKHLCGVRLTVADSGVPTYNILSVTQQQGGLNATCSDVYKDAVDALALKGINVNYTTLYIRIVDPEVFSVLDSLNIGNGTNITPELAATATFGNAFQSNTNIIEFDAYKYFTKQKGATDVNVSAPSFNNCTSLESIDITGSTKIPGFVNCYNLEYFHGRDSEAGTIEFGNITGIAAYEFLNCAKLRRLILTNSLSTGSNAFLFSTEHPNNITRVDIDTIEHLLNCNWSVNGYPFGNNTEVYINNSKLTHLEVPNTISTIKTYALTNYKGLTALTLHGDMTIGGQAFDGCSNLNAVYIDSLADWLSITFNDQPLKHAHNLYINGSLVDNVTIPSGTDLKYKFYGSTSLLSVTIDSGITETGSLAFRECTNLTTVNLPSGFTTIGGESLRECKNLTTINNISDITSVGYYALSGCTGLSTTITDNLVSNLTTIGAGAFFGVNFSTLDLRNATSVGDRAFMRCTFDSLILPQSGLTQLSVDEFRDATTTATSITVPGNIKKIGNYSFCGLKKPRGFQMILSEGVEELGIHAFSVTMWYGEFVIPSTVTSIGENCFYNCGGDFYYKFKGSTPPLFSANSSINSNHDIYVPQGSLQAYIDALHINMSDFPIDRIYEYTE